MQKTINFFEGRYRIWFKVRLRRRSDSVVSLYFVGRVEERHQDPHERNYVISCGQSEASFKHYLRKNLVGLELLGLLVKWNENTYNGGSRKVNLIPEDDLNRIKEILRVKFF